MLSKLVRQYVDNDSGQVAVITAVVAIPMILGVSLAMDSYATDRNRVKLQAALDNAAIAAVADQTLNSDERTEHARARFWANMSAEENVQFTAEAVAANRIDLQGTMEVDTLFAGIIGKQKTKFNANSAAEIVKGATVCMLALDPNSPRSFEVTQGAKLTANCSVQVNSLHKYASIVDFGGESTSEGFCIGGGSQGAHLPFVNTECSTLSDPYQNLEINKPSTPCVDQDELDALINDWRSTRDAVENHEIAQNEALARGEEFIPTYFEKNHLQPGNYCQGLTLEAKELILDPGVYHITGGSLTFTQGTELMGEGVTFVLHDLAHIDIQNGSVMDIKGPISGPLNGLVIAQNLDDKSMLNPSYPNVTSTFTHGSMLNLLGTVYLPSHKVDFRGGSNATTHAPATAFIAHQISISDGADITVSVDHVTAGISPIKPRSDSSVRLVK